MRKLALTVMVASFMLAQPPAVPPVPAASVGGTPGLSMLVFLPQQFFSNEELDPVLKQLSRAGIPARLAATDTTAAVSMNRVMVNPDLSLADVRPEDFAGIVLIGGSGASLYWDDTLLQERCRQFAAAGKVVAAIGIAPVTLARSGVLQGRRATVFRDRDAIGYLREKGARVRFSGLVVDRNLVTAIGAEQAQAFGRAVASAAPRGR